jgi:ubiquitin carboxyl-terminal hydrolase 8
LQRFPDTLIIHIKRFNMTARFGEKIKTLVTFPLRGLDLYQFSTHHMHKDKTSVPGSSQKPMSQESPQRYVYDLYGVTNHIGKYFE